jgi:Zn-dependent protease
MDTAKLAMALLFFVPFLLSLSFHEAAHAFIAFKRGDTTAKALGRMTINPLPHIDPFGTILFPFLAIYYGGPFFGWAKPVPINPMNLKAYKRDSLLISLAGPVSNLILAVVFTFILKIFAVATGNSIINFFQSSNQVFDYPIMTMLNMGIQLNIALAIFNLIPVPPLDGSHILEGILPDSFGNLLARYNRAGYIILIILLFTGILGYLSYPIGLIYMTLLRIFL